MDASLPDGATVRHLTDDDVPGAALAFRTSLGSPPPDEQAGSSPEPEQNGSEPRAPDGDL